MRRRVDDEEHERSLREVRPGQCDPNRGDKFAIDINIPWLMSGFQKIKSRDRRGPCELSSFMSQGRLSFMNRDSDVSSQ